MYLARSQDREVCTPPFRCSRRPRKARPSPLGPIRRRPWHPRGAAPPNLHSQRTITHPRIQWLTSDPLSACEWSARHVMRRHSRITGGPHRTAAAGGVKGPWGLAWWKSLTVILAQSSSWWFSARGREASAGSDRGSPSHPREEREAQKECINHPRTQLLRAGFPDTEGKERGCRRRIGNDRNQEDTARTV